MLARYAGSITRQRDDGMLLYFGYPQAQGEGSLCAVQGQAGLEFLEALRAYKAHLQAEQRLTLAVRIGIHTGLVVMDTLAHDGSALPLAVDEAPIVTTWLPELAAANTLLLSATTARLVAGFFHSQDFGAHRLPTGTTSMVSDHRGEPMMTVHSMPGRAVEPSPHSSLERRAPPGGCAQSCGGKGHDHGRGMGSTSGARTSPGDHERRTTICAV